MRKQSSSGASIALVVLLAVGMGGAVVYLVMSRQQTVTVKLDLPKPTTNPLQVPPRSPEQIASGEITPGNMTQEQAEFAAKKVNALMEAIRQEAIAKKYVEKMTGRTLFVRGEFHRLDELSKRKTCGAFHSQLATDATLYVVNHGDTVVVGTYRILTGYVPAERGDRPTPATFDPFNPER